MTTAVHDACLLFTPGCLSNYRHSFVPRGITALQTDDRLLLGNRSFSVKIQHSSQRFSCKLEVVLVDGQSIKFNDCTISLSKGILKLHRPTQVKALQRIGTNNFDQSRYISQCAKGPYMRSITHPDVAFGFAISSQIITASIDNAKRLIKSIDVVTRKEKWD